MLSQQQAWDTEVISKGSLLWEYFLPLFPLLLPFFHSSPTYTGSNSFSLFGNELSFCSWIPRIMMPFSEHTPA